LESTTEIRRPRLALVYQTDALKSPRNHKLRRLRQRPFCSLCSISASIDVRRLVPVGDNRQCRDYPIEILFCDRCATAHQRFQIPKQESFPQTYD
jgi:hypothetical protein